MEIVIALVVAILFAVVFKSALKKVPWVFYVLTVILDILYLNHVLLGVSPQLDRFFFPYFQRGLLAYGLFVVVMFIGCFPMGSKVRSYLNPIRGELSIVASLLVLGHIVAYFGAYASRVLNGFAGMSSNVVVSFFVALLLLLILAPLTVTSFNKIRKSMDAKTWKKLQKWAYVFFILIYVHMMIILLPSASSPATRAFTSVVIYTVIMIVYIVARLYRWSQDRKQAAAE